MKQILGYILKIDLELNPQLTDKFKFVECPFTRKTSNRSDRIYSKKFYPFDYDEVATNTKILKESPNMMMIKEPVFLDDDLRERMVKWVDWANSVDESEYTIFQ